MTTTDICTFGLVAMRALAEFDPVEYRRATDVSRLELDQRIRQLQNGNDDSEAFDYYRRLISILENFTNESGGQFLLRQIYSSCISIAQFNAVEEKRAGTFRGRTTDAPQIDYRTEKTQGEFQHDQLLRISVMKLLQVLRNYKPLFRYPILNRHIDCLLEPTTVDYPFLIIETKRISNKFRPIEADLKSFADSLRFFGENTLGAIIVPPRSRYSNISMPDGIFLLQFDMSRNDFVKVGFSRLLAWFAERDLL